MARTRQVKPEFFTDEDLWKCDDLTILLFEGLWSIADKSGRLSDNIIFIHGNCLPHRPNANVNAMLDSLHDRGFIVRYSAKDCKYIQIINFEKHQNVHPKEKVSVIPACRGKIAEESRQAHGDNTEEPRRTSFPSFPSIPSLAESKDSVAGATVKEKPKPERSVKQDQLDRVVEYLSKRYGLAKNASLYSPAGAIFKKFKDLGASGDETVWILENHCRNPKDLQGLLEYVQKIKADSLLEITSSARKNVGISA